MLSQARRHIRLTPATQSVVQFFPPYFNVFHSRFCLLKIGGSEDRRLPPIEAWAVTFELPVTLLIIKLSLQTALG